VFIELIESFMKYLFYICLFVLFFAKDGYSQEEHHHGHEKTSGVEALSHDLRHLLSKEMLALQTGMMSIIPDYVSGNWKGIAETAGKMKNSYILKQSLTETQMHELHSLLPKEFIEEDQNFHYLAGMLEHAAEKKKPELINFYFSEMNEACASCHAQFATHKFPKLASDNEKEVHSH